MSSPRMPGAPQVDQLRALLWLLQAGGSGGGGGGGATTTTADFVQPSTFVGSNTVVVDVKKTAGIFVGGFVAVENGGFYLVTALVTDTSITLLNIGDSHNVGGGTTVPKGSVVSVQASNIGDTLGGFSVSSTKPVINLADPQWLVVGDGSDEHGRIQLAINAAISMGAILYVPPPATAYGVGTPLNFDGAQVEGVIGKSLFRATGAMAAVALLSGVNNMTGIFFDGARLANAAALSVGDSGSSYDLCEFDNGLVDGYRQANQTRGGTFTAVVQTGPGPSISLSQIDTYFLELSGDFVMKITQGGALGTAKFVISTNGGVTFSDSHQTLFAETQIALPTGVDEYTTGTGVLVTATAGTYDVDTTYASTIGDFPANNDSDQITFPKCNGCGIVYATAGLIASYPSPTYFPLSAAGTVTTSAGSQIVLGVGTSFLSMGARDGDIMTIVGCFEADGTTPQGLMISCVASDTMIILDLDNTPNQTVVGADFAVIVGYGIFQDVETGNQDSTVIDHPVIATCMNGIRPGGLSGMLITSPTILLPAGSGITNGTAFAD